MKTTKKLNLILLAMAISFTGFAQQEKQADSKITDVTVFLNKAQITREVKTRIDAGKTTLVLTGLTAQLDQQSIQVAGKGNFIILGILNRQNFLSELNTPKSLRLLKDSLEQIQKQVLLEQAQKEILNKEEQMLLTNQKIGGTNQNLTVAELKAMADFYRARLSDIVTTRMKHDDKIKKLNERIINIQRQIRDQNELYSRNTSEIVISLSADVATAVDLNVQYIVANAGWYPVYDLRAINTKSSMQLSYKANVTQGTGEEWKNVKLKLSTANPNLGGVKPELYPWYLNIDQPMYRKLEGKASGMVMRAAPAVMNNEEEIVNADKEKDATSTADYTSTIQTSLNTEFSISLPYTISSSNKPTLVDIRNHELKADYQYAVAPKLDQDAFLLARITGWEEFSLLPGEANIFFEGTFVAKSFIDPNNIKDTLSVSLGRDKRIVVKREKLKDLTTRRFIGSNQRETYAYEISVRNTKAETIKITVEDQLPVSQNGQIEITATDVGGAKYNKETGKLIWEMTLQPNETKKVISKFEVKYPKDKIIYGL